MIFDFDEYSLIWLTQCCQTRKPGEALKGHGNGKNKGRLQNLRFMEQYRVHIQLPRMCWIERQKYWDSDNIE